MKNIHNYSKSFRKDESGSVLILAGVFILVAFAIAGASVDFGRAQLVQIRQQQALDSAALAAANVVERTPGAIDTERVIRRNAGSRYYNLNFSNGYLGSDTSTTTFNYVNQFRIDMTGNAALPTNYINTMGTTNLSTFSEVSVVMPNNQPPNFDVVMVIDQSGSTKEDLPNPTGGKPVKRIIDAEKDAISKMLDVIFPNGQPVNPNVRFGLVGYSGAILNAFGLTSLKAQAQSYIDPLEPYFNNYDMWGLEAGMKMLTEDWTGFVPPQQCTLVPPTLPPVITLPDCIGAPGSYCIPEGDQGSTGCSWFNAAGERCSFYDPDYPPVLPQCIPERNTGVPAPATARSDGLLTSNNKYLVLISDGYIMQEPAPCPWGEFYRANFPAIDTEEPLPGDTCKNYRAFLDQCAAIKAAGITIYTINFVSQTADDIAPMRACASSPDKYFFAPNEATLESILSGIATQIYRIKIVK